MAVTFNGNYLKGFMSDEEFKALRRLSKRPMTPYTIKQGLEMIS